MGEIYSLDLCDNNLVSGHKDGTLKFYEYDLKHKNYIFVKIVKGNNNKTSKIK